MNYIKHEMHGCMAVNQLSPEQKVAGWEYCDIYEVIEEKKLKAKKAKEESEILARERAEQDEKERLVAEKKRLEKEEKEKIFKREEADKKAKEEAEEAEKTEEMRLIEVAGKIDAAIPGELPKIEKEMVKAKKRTRGPNKKKPAKRVVGKVVIDGLAKDLLVKAEPSFDHGIGSDTTE